MTVDIPSEWLYPSSLEKAEHVQRELAKRTVLTDDFSFSHLVGGMDVSNNLYDTMIYASAVVLNTSSLQLAEETAIGQSQPFPYIPGFLVFREAPALVTAFKQLKKRPEIILVDGHGISHPRRLGIASHLGVLLDIPTIGVAKSVLVGHSAGLLGDAKGDTVPLVWKGEQIGMFLRSKVRCNPLIISTGHRISLQSAVEIVLQCLTRYRLPEPTRQAHLAANRCRRENKQEQNN
jgi:deoxyribonuclease V